MKCERRYSEEVRKFEFFSFVACETMTKRDQTEKHSRTGRDTVQRLSLTKQRLDLECTKNRWRISCRKSDGKKIVKLSHVNKKNHNRETEFLFTIFSLNFEI